LEGEEKNIMRVLYFAEAADVVGCREEVWDETEPLTAAEFWAKLICRHARMESLRARCRLAVNQQFLSQGETIPPHSEVAVLPPVSGG
jgi:molybdopterin converting factor subunit 1